MANVDSPRRILTEETDFAADNPRPHDGCLEVFADGVVGSDGNVILGVSFVQHRNLLSDGTVPWVSCGNQVEATKVIHYEANGFDGGLPLSVKVLCRVLL